MYHLGRSIGDQILNGIGGAMVVTRSLYFQGFIVIDKHAGKLSFCPPDDSLEL